MDKKVIEGISGILEGYIYSDMDNLLGTSMLIYDKMFRKLVLVGYVPDNYLDRDKKGTCLKLAKLA